MTTFLQPLWELLNGDAYNPHPADAALPLGRRFQSRVIVAVGGGGTGTGWTQRVKFDRHGVAALEGRRSANFKRGTAEWGDHLMREAAASSGWAVILIEQQWQAASSTTSAASLGVGGVEQMLRVRDAVSDFGDDRMSEDAVRAAVDHPTMESSIVVGVRSTVLEPLEKELVANGFAVAAVRVVVFSLLERYLARLQRTGTSPSRTIVAYDGQSALIVGVRDGAFDMTDGSLSYLVNRPPADVRTQVGKRISSPTSLREWSGKVEIIGTTFSFENGQLPEGVDVTQEHDDLVLAAVDDAVRHDLRPELQEMRLALPRWVRSAVAASLVLALLSAVGVSIQAAEALRYERGVDEKRREVAEHQNAAALSRAGLENLKQDEAVARQIANWVDKNYHTQALVQAFFTALPSDVSLDGVSLQAAEGLPQAKIKFTLLGAEDAQRAALRLIESKLYQLGYEVGKRDDPTLSTHRRGGVVYAWDLIIPSFGSAS